MEAHEVGIPLEALPERIRPLLAPDAPANRKMMVARAAVPMPPDELVPALAFLTNERDAEIRNQARKSLEELPEANLLPVLSARTTSPGVLDRLARVFSRSDAHLQKLLLNRATPDDTFVFVARHAEGHVLDLVAQNQERLKGRPDIVQAIYFNPKAKMSTVSRVLEFAVREDLPIHHMPGYKEIVASVLGEARLARPMAGADAEPVAPPPEAAEEAEEALAPEDLLEQAFGDEEAWDEEDDEVESFHSDADMMDELLGEHTADDDDLDMFMGEQTSPGIEEEADDAFFAVLSAAMQDGEGEGEGESSSAFVSDKIRDMNVSERVRLALMGNNSCRGILVRDANRLVCTAVMRNPGLNEREIMEYAGNRNISSDVLRIIAQSREWTRNYQLKKTLVENPKTPQAFAMQFIKHLRERDLKDISKNRDVSPTIARMAKRVVDERSKKK